MLQALVNVYSRRSRRKRGRVFWSYLTPREEDKILDLGSEDGAHIAALIPFRRHVFIADINEALLQRGAERYGFTPLVLDESGRIPVSDKYFDIVFCSSVIEHVTVDKGDVARIKSGVEFRKAALARQRRFAEEIRRIAHRYWVQTPYKYFPIESHTWLPAIIVVLPRRLQITVIQTMNRWWPKKARPDWNLLTISEMRELFPDAQIVIERSLWLPKSIMAVKR
jgi:hypothetical protein